MGPERQQLSDRPGNRRRLLRILFLCCAALLVMDLFYHRHVVHAWESLWGFYPLFGFFAGVLLVPAAGLLRRMLKRPEGYYDE